VIARIHKVRKRDGRIVDFDETKIADAIYKAACAVGGDDRFLAEELAGVVTLFLEKQYAGTVPGIEEIQDMVEKVLIETGHARTAKAYILYRDRRARAREQIEVRAEGLGEGGAGPLVGNAAKAAVSPWSKRRIVEALHREADLDEKVASEVASRVEEKVFRCRVPRISTSAIRSLVEAELFLMGYGDRVGKQALIGLPRFDADRMIRAKRSDGWRPEGPRDLKRAVADAVLAQYALAEVYGPEVVDAHLEGRLHLYDAGCPFEWIAAVARAPRAADPDAFVEGAALLAGRLGEVVTREARLLGLVPGEARWAEGARGGAAAEAARRLLGHVALRSLDRRGGRFRLGFTLPGVPDEESSTLLVDAFLREHWARFRAGAIDLLPEIALEAHADRLSGDTARRVLLPALANAAETGRIAFHFDRSAAPALVAPWYRLLEPELGEGGLPVAGAVALHLPALARGATSEESLVEALEPAVALAAKALRQKRSFLASLAADPSGPLYRIAAGARPLLQGAKGLDLLVLTGLAEAVRPLSGGDEAQARSRGRLRSYLALRAAEEGRKARLRIALAPERDGEAARRFGLDPLSDLEPAALPPGLLLEGVEARYEPLLGTLELAFPRESAPGPETLFDALRRLAEDPKLATLRLRPWPDRALRPAPAERSS